MARKVRTLKDFIQDLRQLEIKKNNVETSIWVCIHKEYSPMSYNDPLFGRCVSKLIQCWEDQLRNRDVSLTKPLNHQIRQDSLKDACSHFAWDCKYGTKEISLDEFIQFVESLSSIESDIADAMDSSEVEWSLSDDSFSDFTDMLPLCGSLIIAKILRKEFKSYLSLTKEINKTFPKWLYVAIVDSESYLQTNLMQSVIEYI